MATSNVRQNFHEESENGINGQINKELYASYVYLSMAYYFDRDDIALKGFHKYFKNASDEEKGHAEKLMQYLNKRGGRIQLKDIAAPNVEWGSPLNAMQEALKLEKIVNQSLLDLHSVASRHGDANMCDFIETEYLQEQVDAIKQISDYVSNLQRVGNGLGEFIFDKELAE